MIWKFWGLADLNFLVMLIKLLVFKLELELLTIVIFMLGTFKVFTLSSILNTLLFLVYPELLVRLALGAHWFTRNSAWVSARLALFRVLTVMDHISVTSATLKAS